MPLPLDDRRLLPPGVHDATLDDVDQAFARFQRSDRRITLFQRLTAYVTELRKAGVGLHLIVDGSFVMGCIDEPNDIDLMLVMPPTWDSATDMKPHEYNLVSKRRVRADYRFDLFAVAVGSEDEAKWLEFFSGIKDERAQEIGWPLGSRKGIVRVVL